MGVQLPDDEPKAGAPDWVVTFGDMMSLLLTFFVLLLSFSTMEAQRFKMISGYMRQAFGLQTKENYTGIPMGTTILSTDVRTQANPSDELKLIQAVRRQLEKSGMAKNGSVELTTRGVSVRLKGEMIFDSGRAALKSEALQLLDGIAELAAQRPGTLEVEGHTDDIPVSTARFPSNWELSSSRAGSAARYLLAQGVPPTHIKAVGYADTRPLVPNDSPENRSKNRRVEFLFVRAAPEDASEEAQPGGDPPGAQSPSEPPWPD